MFNIFKRYTLVSPKVQTATKGLQWSAPAYIDPFENVFVASNSTNVTIINAKLADGFHVILTPGIYYLTEPIRIGRKASIYQVLLGLGLATLIPTAGFPAIVVNSGGVRVCGLLLQAGAIQSPSLLQVGNDEDKDGSTQDPILLADVFARVGGPDSTDVFTVMMVELNASNVIVDNMWLWRADVGNTSLRRDCSHALVVNGDDVVVYGLAAEHVQSDITVWNGEGGQLFFYQCELDSFAHEPGDNTPDYGPNGVAGYRVNAKNHSAMGVGVYVWQVLSGVIVQAGTKVLHADLILSGIFCPFKWVFNPEWWVNGNSTIEHAILPVFL